MAIGGAGTAASSVTYGWSGGTFDDPYAAETKYLCASPGAHELFVTITGTGEFAACASSAPLVVGCQ
jgi:hypothetical protein